VSVAAVIPVKPLTSALGRLGRILDAPERRALQAAMLEDVLGACREASALAAVLVVSSDPEAGEIARALGATVLSDHRPPQGMNAAVEIGLGGAEALGADAALVLTADLPLARGADLDTLRARLAGTTGVVLSPSLDGTGTNAMLLAPPRALRPELGIGSLARHLAQAERLGVGVEIVPRPGLALDVDTPEDLARLCEREGASRAHEVAARLGLGERVAAVGAR
jgi:2-phospho-L-lactate guanylyltransferase